LNLDETKEDVAKSIIWLCRHSWVSPTSTRLPAPLYFGNKLSKLVSDTETPVSPNDMEAPLFL
jgi:argonaute-like protein implicated in RNA metabolism and viral defense